MNVETLNSQLDKFKSTTRKFGKSNQRQIILKDLFKKAQNMIFVKQLN